MMIFGSHFPVDFPMGKHVHSPSLAPKFQVIWNASLGLVLMDFDPSYLVGGIPTPLKNMNVNWDDEIPNV